MKSHVLCEDRDFKPVAHRAKYSILNRYSLSPKVLVPFSLYILVDAFIIHHSPKQVKSP